MRFGKKTAYGLFALVYVAKHNHNGQIQGREIAKACQLPEEYLLKILQILVRGGILKSTRGRTGGFALQRPASDISLNDIITSLESQLSMAEVLEEVWRGHPRIKQQLCQVHEELLHCSQISLGKVTLQELVELSHP